MPRPKDPNSLSARIRACFTDGRTIIAYAVPPGTDSVSAGPLLRSNLPRIRVLLRAVRAQCEGEYHPDYYGRYYRGDQHRDTNAWIEEDLGCIYIGHKPEPAGARRIFSRAALYGLAPGETGIVSLANKSERDMQADFDSRSDLHWREDGMFPVFEVHLAEPDKVTLTDKHADFLITRRLSLPHNPARSKPEADSVADPDPDAPTRALPDPEPEAALWRDDDGPDVPLTP